MKVWPQVRHEGNGAAEGTRTPDPRITNAMLYQLSYSSACPQVRQKVYRHPAQYTSKKALWYRKLLL